MRVGFDRGVSPGVRARESKRARSRESARKGEREPEGAKESERGQDRARKSMGKSARERAQQRDRERERCINTSRHVPWGSPREVASTRCATSAISAVPMASLPFRSKICSWVGEREGGNGGRGRGGL